MNKGLPIVISAPSGCGKDTILEQLYKKKLESYAVGFRYNKSNA